jgi:hypothetical protein
MDTALTAGGFVVILAGVAFVVISAPFYLMLSDGAGQNPPKLLGYLVFGAVLIPPIVVVGVYITAVVLACLASGPTFYYPLIALTVGAALWAGTVTGIGAWIDRIK